MIVLDTNVVSELMRAEPDPAVEAWVARRPASTLYFSAVGEAELLFGLAVMPAGKRRDALESRIEAMLRVDFAGRVLPFDSRAARVFAETAVAGRAAGRPASQFDTQIAAIARSRDMSLATRNTRDFSQTGVALINPWTTD